MILQIGKAKVSKFTFMHTLSESKSIFAIEQMAIVSCFVKNVAFLLGHLVYTQLTFRCLKYIKGIFSPDAVCHSYFLIPWQSFYAKGAKSLKRSFFQLSKRNLVDFIEISGNRCANTNIHRRRLNHPTQLLF